MEAAGKRNWQFDFLKGICCIFVVFLHCPFPGILGDLIIYAARFPVPIFFMITGYYSCSRDRAWIQKKAVHILKMLLLSELFYGAWNSLLAVLAGGSPAAYLRGQSSLSHPVQTLLCGSFFNGVLWYLYAAFWTYCILWFFSPGGKRPGALYLLIPPLLCVQIFGRFYVQNHFDINLYIHLFRNALSFGLPLTLLGSLFAALKERIQRRLRWQHTFLLLVLGGFVMVAEYLISRQYMDFHLSTLLTSAGLFLLAMTCPFAEPKPLAPVSRIGRSLSMWIYLSHIFFHSLLNLLAKAWGFSDAPLFLWTRPLWICFLSALFGLLADRLRLRAARQKGTGSGEQRKPAA